MGTFVNVLGSHVIRFMLIFFISGVSKTRWRVDNVVKRVASRIETGLLPHFLSGGRQHRMSGSTLIPTGMEGEREDALASFFRSNV